PYQRVLEGKSEILRFAQNDNVVAASTFQRFNASTTMIPPELLLQGYRLGIFPMAMEDDSIEWFSPERRGIIPLETFHLPHAARRAWVRKSFEVRIDSAFSEVIRACARRGETWINEEIVASHAHLVEAWQKGKLAGGLYGVAIGGGFFGESMFHRVTDASKIALAGLVEQ